MSAAPERLELEEHGAALFRGAALPVLEQLETALTSIDRGHAGIRAAGNPDLAGLVATTGAIGGLAAAILGSGCRPVRAILFDKTAGTNWALGWHQDRTIAVCQRLEIPGVGPWTVKQGLLHVEPVPEDNAPLLIAPGSHLLGRSPS